MLLLCWKIKYDRSEHMKCWHGVQDLNFTLMVFQCLRLLQAYYCLNFRLCMNHFLGVFSHTSIIVLLSQFLRSSLHDTLLQALVSAPIPPGVSPLAFSKSTTSCVFLPFSLLFFISRTMLLISCFPSFGQTTWRQSLAARPYYKFRNDVTNRFLLHRKAL